ncbi:hypothetical protein DFS34DRAFT_686072 [Phlyctochytrium arcticum]|nr:hypothetical protein DFS34DRAFT_686072 [Phlyctochytrium arcticum]
MSESSSQNASGQQAAAAAAATVPSSSEALSNDTAATSTTSAAVPSSLPPTPDIPTEADDGANAAAQATAAAHAAAQSAAAAAQSQAEAAAAGNSNQQLLIPMLPFPISNLFTNSQVSGSPVRLPGLTNEQHLAQLAAVHAQQQQQLQEAQQLSPLTPSASPAPVDGQRNNQFTHFRKLNWVNSSPQHFSTDDASILGKKRRRRTTASELGILENHFLKNPLPNAYDRELLARETGMTTRSVQVWFQNKRQSLKKKSGNTERRLTSEPERKNSPTPSPHSVSRPEEKAVAPLNLPFIPIFATNSTYPSAALQNFLRNPSQWSAVVPQPAEQSQPGIVAPEVGPGGITTQRTLRPLGPGDEGHDIAALALVNLSQSGKSSPPPADGEEASKVDAVDSEETLVVHKIEPGVSSKSITPVMSALPAANAVILNEKPREAQSAVLV